MSLNGILIAAGTSSRYGKIKALEITDGRTFASEILTKMFLICDRVSVVLGHEHDLVFNRIIKELTFTQMKRISFVVNYDYDQGMFSSLKNGIISEYYSDYLLYHFVDQPFIPSEFYRILKEKSILGYDWIQPEYKSRRGHPILFSKKIISAIYNERNSGSLREIRENPEIKKLFYDSPFQEILIDIDTQLEFKNIKERKSNE